MTNPAAHSSDDIPVTEHKIDTSWEELAPELESVAIIRKEPTQRDIELASDETMRVRVLKELTEAIAPAFARAIDENIDAMVGQAVSNTYQRLRGDLSRQVKALAVRTVREELEKILKRP